MQMRHALLILAGAVIAGAVVIVELPRYEARRDAERAEAKAAAGLRLAQEGYKTRKDIRLITAKVACQEAVRSWLNDPSPVFTDLDDWPATENSLEHFTVDLKVRARGEFEGYRLLDVRCETAHDVKKDGWSNHLTLQDP